jgi:hypothetical protein
MKFKDIPPFTRCPSSGETVALHRFKGFIDRSIAEYNLILEPDFQRGHIWTREQQILFVEFQLRGGQTGKDLYFNDPEYLGCSSKGYQEYVCVDGLQRITALLAFLNDEIPAFGYLCSEFEDKPFNISMNWHINDLKTRKEVLNWYIEMNSGGTPHTESELERIRRMLENEGD